MPGGDASPAIRRMHSQPQTGNMHSPPPKPPLRSARSSPKLAQSPLVTETTFENVSVGVRVLPGSHEEAISSSFQIFPTNALIRARDGAEFAFDQVYAGAEPTLTVYNDSVKRIVGGVMEGFHGTVFAYGQTGTGKTYSMQGTEDSPGIIPLAIHDIYACIGAARDTEYVLRASYLELYNERLRDLLTHSANEPVIRMDSQRGTYATPVREEIVTSPEKLLEIVRRGDAARKTASTDFNARSSRSHAIVQIVVEAKKRNGGRRLSTLNLIDLAGSERAAVEKERQKEGGYINKSLLTLGTVIARLTTAGNTDHIPFRDSKLTRLLQPALTGSALVSILATVSFARECTAETMSTLKFAARAKRIVSHAVRSQVETDVHLLVEQYRRENEMLKRRLAQTQSKTPHPQPIRVREDVKEGVVEMQLARTALKERIEHLTHLILTSKPTPAVRNFSAPAATALAHTHHSMDDTSAFAERITQLQQELSDRGRYIATLETRLLQARRQSRERERHDPQLREARACQARVLELERTVEDKDRVISALQASLQARAVAEFKSAERVFAPRNVNIPSKII